MESGSREAVIFKRLEDLPQFENLQLVTNLNQLRLHKNSPLKCWSLAHQKTFVAEYHSCPRVTSFLTDKGIASPPQGFGKLLPVVKYQRAQPCRFCGAVNYTRPVSTHSDLYHKRHGYLHCTGTGCDGWITLNVGENFGQEYSWLANSTPMPKPIVPTDGLPCVAINRIEQLPSFEMLQLVDNLEQLIVPRTSPCIEWTLETHKEFIAGYHSCSKVATYLIDNGITVPPNHFGRLLPKVLYHTKKPCRYCGTHRYTRRVSSRGDLSLGLSGCLNCEGCDAWITLSKGGSFGEENSLQFKRANNNKVSAFKAVHIDQSPINKDFLNAILQRYVPEYQHLAITQYISGSLTLEQVEERTGIFIEG